MASKSLHSVGIVEVLTEGKLRILTRRVRSDEVENMFVSEMLTEADDDDQEEEEEEEEEVLDEEEQLMASMGLPLAFSSSSDQRRAVSQSHCLTAQLALYH